MLVLAGNEAGLEGVRSRGSAGAGPVPAAARPTMPRSTRPCRPRSLPSGPGAAGPGSLFHQPAKPLIDGRGHVWWPGAATTAALRDYTLGHQVVEPYDFTAAIRTAAREFAPDYFIIPGPGTTLGGAVAQSLIRANWRGLACKADFQRMQAETPFLISMALPDQRATCHRSPT
jgi:[acyl-carrier-protein] S-malonyltransferase